MSETLFISDLHLDPQWPAITDAFLALLANRARDSDGLFILGDLFEAWIGDDDPSEHHHTVKSALRALTDTGVPVFFQHGNRDFLIGDDFSKETGVHLIEESCVIDLYGTPVLVMHGDLLCTDDIEYQQVRSAIRSDLWRNNFLSKSIDERLELTRQYREQSKQSAANKMRESADDITDVNPLRALRTMQENQVNILIHGHTHRPMIHHPEANNSALERIVLPDWTEQRHGLLSWAADAHQLEFFDVPSP